MVRTFSIRPPLQTFVDVESYVSIGNGKLYPKEVREMVIRRHVLGLPRVDEHICLLLRHHKYPSLWMIKRWIVRYNAQGHILPFWHTGNKRVTREVRGLDTANLALIRANLPESMLYEVKTFLYSANPVQIPFSNSQTHRVENILGLTRKAALTTAFAAYIPFNL